jgi:hypothetical protein
MNSPPLVLSPSDRFDLDRIAEEIENPEVSTERLIEILAEVGEMAERYHCDLTLHGNEVGI